MPHIPQVVQQSLYELQEYCSSQEDCRECPVEPYCNFIQQGHYLSDIEMPAIDIKLGCKDKHICAEYIVTTSNLKSRLSKANLALALAESQRDAFKNALDRLCPNWKHQLAEAKLKEDVK